MITYKSVVPIEQAERREQLLYNISKERGSLLYDFSHWIKEDKEHRKKILYNDWSKLKDYLCHLTNGTLYIRQNQYDLNLLSLYAEVEKEQFANQIGCFKRDDNSFGTFLYETFLSKKETMTSKEQAFNWIDALSSSNKWSISPWDDNKITTAIDSTYGKTINNMATSSIVVSSADVIDKIKNEIKENNKMETSKMFGKFDFGKVSSDKVRMSPYGLAVKNTDGTWVAYDVTNESIMNVDVFNFDGANFLFKIPVAIDQVAAGDMIIHNRTPKFVKHINPDKTLYVVDIASGEISTVLPTKSPFGFNFITKVVNVLGDMKANADSPFGNMLPLMLMGDANTNDMLPLIMMMNGGQFDMSNPLMLYALMGKGNNDILPFLLMNSIGNGVKTNA